MGTTTSLGTRSGDSATQATTAPPEPGCSSSCGCGTDATDQTDAPATASSAAADDTTAPVACTLGAGEMSTRLAEWRELLDHDPQAGSGVVARRALADGGLRLEFGPSSDVTEIAQLAAAEHSCCRFFAFAVTIDSRGLALEVHAPPDGQPVLADLFGTAA
jgi:MerR family copper efflux transcriptional regulator